MFRRIYNFLFLYFTLGVTKSQLIALYKVLVQRDDEDFEGVPLIYTFVLVKNTHVKASASLHLSVTSNYSDARYIRLYTRNDANTEWQLVLDTDQPKSTYRKGAWEPLLGELVEALYWLEK